ncbi:MAG: hypothetical protein JWM25_1287 [Thermoleophilia bacterium]|nr:hypothetical protein [Thermoleophilia bacterium]
MWQLVLKGVISGAIVVAASEVARRSTVWAAVLVSLPLTSILALAWLWFDTRDVEQVSSLSWAILWIVLPSMLFFVALPLLLRWGVPFIVAIVAACAVMAVAYVGYVALLDRLGVES